jgi:hypothetical protein
LNGIADHAEYFPQLSVTNGDGFLLPPSPSFPSPRRQINLAGRGTTGGTSFIGYFFRTRNLFFKPISGFRLAAAISGLAGMTSFDALYP